MAQNVLAGQIGPTLYFFLETWGLKGVGLSYIMLSLAFKKINIYKNYYPIFKTYDLHMT